MKLRRFLSVALVSLSLTLAGTALADAPKDFVFRGQTTLTNLLKEPASSDRDKKVAATLDGLVDYPELVRRCFKGDWAQLADAQKTEVGDLLHKLVEKNYRKNLKRTLDYTIEYTGSQALGSDTRVGTKATNKANAREVVQVDYVIAGPAGGPYRIVDIVTENSFLTNAYYTQFHKMLATPGQGYPYIVTKLKEKLAKP